jgi:hypothetical protein
VNASIVELKPSQQVSVQVETDYVTQKHECTSLAEFVPDECVPCAGCGHAECRHDPGPAQFSEKPAGLTAEQLQVWRYAEARWVIAAMQSSPCDVDGCECTRMKSGDECLDCNGEGCHEDERTGRTYTCTTCRGNQVIA